MTITKHDLWTAAEKKIEVFSQEDTIGASWSEPHTSDVNPDSLYVYISVCHTSFCIYESSEGLSSTTYPEPRGNPPTACSGKPMSIKQKAEPLRCLALRTRGGML